MLEVVTLCVMGCCLLMAVRMSLWLRRLKEETGRLPEPAAGAMAMMEPLLGRNLREAVPFPPQYAHVPAVVVIASPTCPPCLKEMENLAEAYRGRPFPVPVLCILRHEQEESFEKYVRKYGSLLPIVPASDEVLMTRLGVQGFPSAMIMDAGGVVRVVDLPVTKLVDQLHDLVRQAG